MRKTVAYIAVRPLVVSFFLVSTLAIAGDLMNPVTIDGKGVVHISKDTAIEISSSSHVADLTPSNKVALMGMKLDLKLSARGKKIEVIVPWEALAKVNERQGTDRFGFWVPLLRIAGDSNHEAVLSFYGPCNKKDVQVNAASDEVSISIGQPLDGCDVLKLTYYEKVAGSTCIVYEYLINPCSRTLALPTIALSH